MPAGKAGMLQCNYERSSKDDDEDTTELMPNMKMLTMKTSLLVSPSNSTKMTNAKYENAHNEENHINSSFSLALDQQERFSL